MPSFVEAGDDQALRCNVFLERRHVDGPGNADQDPRATRGRISSTTLQLWAAKRSATKLLA